MRRNKRIMRKGGKPTRGRKMKHGGIHPTGPSRDVIRVPNHALVTNIQRGDGHPIYVQGNLVDMVGPIHGPCPPGSERLADGFCKIMEKLNMKLTTLKR